MSEGTPSPSLAPLSALLFAAVLPLFVVANAAAQLPPPPAEVLSDAYPGPEYSPYAGRAFPSRVFWGDTHLHTDASFDAGAFGNRLAARGRRG